MVDVDVVGRAGLVREFVGWEDGEGGGEGGGHCWSWGWW